MTNYLDLTTEEKLEALKALGAPVFRARQIGEWILKGAESFDEMLNLPKDLRSALAQNYAFTRLAPELVQTASDGTRKFLLRLPDGNKIEAVFMRYEYGNSLCVSTQVGCRMGCRFCASTKNGKVRDLKAWEILDEFLVCRREAGDINHIVLMGIGEPFDNYEEVAAFLRAVHDTKGPDLSYRNITVSTCGLVPYIERFGDEFPQVNLAISLHEADQAKREALMPVAKSYALPQLIAACRSHSEKTGRRVSFEYTLIKGQNDSPADAEALASLLKGMLCHVNLIPPNPVSGSGFGAPEREAAYAFQHLLEDKGITATVRRSLGREIDAACGQLRNKN
ncbi:MAG: 23S rRNA (adenine(2503)-C(2))-methyltransferase RlmN [Firmicutes bacterium]|nr:23S rRNA (adenine(2503)-C(2))-methyltransferase RlmN [Bacillota bacterium]